MRLKKIVGYCLIASPLFAFIIACGVFLGGWSSALVALGIVVVALAFTTLIVTGVNLITEDDENDTDDTAFNLEAEISAATTKIFGE